MRAAAVAVTFLTRLPVPGSGALQPGALGRSVVWFPLVGAVVGGAVGGTRLLADLALPATASTALALAVGVLLTGGLHEDGLADTADGLGAHTTPERRLEIMRDPRVGTYGALALIASFVLAWSLLSSLDGLDCLLAALTAHSLARWAMPVAAVSFPPARVGGAGGLMTVGVVQLAGATLLAAGVALASVGPVEALASIGAALVVTLALGLCAVRAVGGLTGDVYGAAEKLVELAVFSVLVAFWT
jgi:adenosylcobinamide-GDP ribazoletransferase